MRKSRCKLHLEWCKKWCKLHLECKSGANCTWSSAKDGANCTWNGAKNDASCTLNGVKVVQTRCNLHMFLHLHVANYAENEVQSAHVFAPTLCKKWCTRGAHCTWFCTLMVKQWCT